MKKLNVKTDSRVNQKFENYPDFVKNKMLRLRERVIETAQEMNEVEELQETLKWGEPSFLSNSESTLRMDWKEKTPNQYAMFFQCSSRLVDTFRLVFDQEFNFEGNRAIIFNLNEKINETELKKCIQATLRYHTVKNLEFLGIY